MDYKKSFYTLLGTILLFCFYSFVEGKKSYTATIAQSVQPQELANQPLQPVVAAPVIEPLEPLVKKELAEVHHRKNVEAFEKETTKAYYSDGKIVEYKKKMRKQAQIEERNLENEFAKIFNEN